MKPDVDERRIAAAGVGVHLRSAGTGEPVLLLHGLGASSYSWRNVLPALGPGFRALAPDWPGFGRSAQPDEFDYSLDGFRDWLFSFMDAAGVGKAALVGNSMGGMIALAAAMARPGRVSRLVLLGTPVYPENRPPILWHLRRPLIGPLYEALLGPWAVRFIARTAFVDRACITPELLEEYGMALRTRAGRAAVARFIRNAVPPDAVERVRRYRELAVPTLVILGDRDPIVDPASAERFARTLPDGRLLTIASCGHAPQEEKPAEVLAAMRLFLQIAAD